MYPLAYDEANELLARYSIHVPHVLTASSEEGARIGIDAFEDENKEKRIALRARRFWIAQPCPIAYGHAGLMIDQLHSKGCVQISPVVHLMLSNLLVRSAKLFLNEELESLSLDPIYIHKNDYSIGAVKLFSLKHPHIRKRLAPDAHDRRAVFPYRPTARLS